MPLDSEALKGSKASLYSDEMSNGGTKRQRLEEREEGYTGASDSVDVTLSGELRELADGRS